MPDNDVIQKRAYTIWEQEGRPEGRHQEHWNQAETELSPANGSKQDYPNTISAKGSTVVPENKAADLPSLSAKTAKTSKKKY